MTENTNVDADAQNENDAEERTEFAWVNQSPTTELTGTPVGVIYGGSLDSNTEQNGTSFGVLLQNPRVTEGTLFRNAAKEDGLTRDEFEDANPTDYRVADVDDRDATFDRDGNLTTGEKGSHVYEEADAFDEDTVLVWYNGMSGQIIGRRLDFNGLPFAERNSEGYLKKGLLQVAEGWRDRSNRSSLVKEGKGPRVVRPPLLRTDVEDTDVTISIGRYNGGRMYEAHVLPTDKLDGRRVSEMDIDDIRDIELEYLALDRSEADARINEEGIEMALYDGDGWDVGPENTAPDMSVELDDVSGDDNGLTPEQQEFVDTVSKTLAGTDLTPDVAFKSKGGIAGLMGQNGISGDKEAITRAIYEQTEHLDVGSL